VFSLIHRYLSFKTHDRWICIVDEEFTNWQPNAMQRAGNKFDTIPFVKRVDSLKIWAGGALLMGILGAFVFLVSSTATPQVPPVPLPISNLPNTSQVVNVFPPTTHLEHNKEVPMSNGTETTKNIPEPIERRGIPTKSAPVKPMTSPSQPASQPVKK